MSGVCLDSLNPTGNPTKRRLNSLGVDAVRIEIRDGTKYMNYVDSLQDQFQHYALIGPSTNWVFPLIANIVRPQVIIIGNEPDGVGPSSWTMTPEEYIQLWNKYAPQLREYYPNIKLATAGMVGNTDYLSSVFDRLVPTPDLVNKHYPNNKEEILAFYDTFARPVIVGEWCWKTATQDEMTNWIDVLTATTYEHFWFCWSDGMVDGMGLTSKQGRITNTYRRYKKAIRGL